MKIKHQKSLSNSLQCWSSLILIRSCQSQAEQYYAKPEATQALRYVKQRPNVHKIPTVPTTSRYYMIACASNISSSLSLSLGRVSYTRKHPNAPIKY